jgi:hypothetical protein
MLAVAAPAQAGDDAISASSRSASLALMPVWWVGNTRMFQGKMLSPLGAQAVTVVRKAAHLATQAIERVLSPRRENEEEQLSSHSSFTLGRLPCLTGTGASLLGT